MYYLKSRYYDPEICRFINADGYASNGQGVIGCNSFAYCNNNPIIYIDSDGNSPLIGLVWGLVASIGLLLEIKGIQNTSENNRANALIDANEATSTKNKLITNQRDARYSGFVYGLEAAANNVCEVAAVHNVKVKLGMDSSLSSTMVDFQKSFAMSCFGIFGSAPKRIGKVLERSGIEYTTIGIDSMTEDGLYIISYWNPHRPWNGLHTIAVENIGGSYTAYNYRGGVNAFYTNDIGNDFIIGYYIKG